MAVPSCRKDSYSCHYACDPKPDSPCYILKRSLGIVCICICYCKDIWCHRYNGKQGQRTNKRLMFVFAMICNCVII